MSMVAQTRDLNDRKTIVDFAEKVQSLERLKLLLVLTICDIRAVGPGCLERLEGAIAAHALLRNRASPFRRLLGTFAQGARPAGRARAATTHCRRLEPEGPQGLFAAALSIPTF
jgi:hypothetical protein